VECCAGLADWQLDWHSYLALSSKRAGSTFLRLSPRNCYHIPRRPNQRPIKDPQCLAAPRGLVTAITPAARTVIRVFRNPWRIPTIPGRRKRNNQGFDTGGQNVLKQNTHEKTHKAALTQSVRREIAPTT
jgi:hypothetical protein